MRKRQWWEHPGRWEGAGQQTVIIKVQRQKQLIGLSPQKVVSGPVKAQSVSGSAVLRQIQLHCKCNFAQCVFALSADTNSGDGWPLPAVPLLQQTALLGCTVRRCLGAPGPLFFLAGFRFGGGIFFNQQNYFPWNHRFFYHDFLGKYYSAHVMQVWGCIMRWMW